MAKENEKESNSLLDFNFSDDTEFFGIKPDGDSETDTIKAVKSKSKNGEDVSDLNEDSSTKSKAKAKTDEEEDDEDEEGATSFFGEDEEDKPKSKAGKKKAAKEDDEDEDEEDVETESTKVKAKAKPKEKEEEAAEGDESDDEFFTTLTQELKEKGVFQNIELKKDEVITQDKFFELQDQEIESRVNETFEAFFEELDEDGKKFLKFLKDGGKAVDYLATLAVGPDIEEYDESNDAQTKRVLTKYLIEYEKLDADELEDRLAYLKEGGKEKTMATKYFTKMQKAKDDAIKQLTKDTEEATTKAQEANKKFNDDLKAVLVKTEAIGDFPISKKEQAELGDFITKPTVKVGKAKYVPELQVRLSEIFSGKTKENKEKLILLAKLVKNNFEVPDLVRETETKVVKKAKSNLLKAKAGIKTASSGKTGSGGLSDFFD